MKRWILMGLVFIFLLGCSDVELGDYLEDGRRSEPPEETGELIASVETWEYDPLGEYISITIWITNSSDKYINYYEIYYRVDYDETYKRDFFSGYRLREGYTRKEYTHTKIGKDRVVDNVVVDDVVSQTF